MKKNINLKSAHTPQFFGLSKLANRATVCVATSENPVRFALLSFVVLALLLFLPQNTLAQWNLQSPAVEVTNFGYIMFGPNDLNDNSNDNHVLTFGSGQPSPHNAGLWSISGSYQELFYIGRTHNTTTNNAGYEIDTSCYSETGGRRMIVIDPNMNVGIDKWTADIRYKLDVSGNIRSTDFVYFGSDRRYKRDIEPISNLDNLFKINAVQYKRSGEAFAEQLEILKKEGKLNASDLVIAEAGIKSIIGNRNSDNTIHYGFIAQELREVYPNLVSEDSHGFLSVNYTGLIPVLVDAIKELKAEIDELKGRDFVKVNTTEVVSSAKLYQNNPNPFDTQTEINYYIPSVAVNATICVYDMVGAEVLKMEIRGRESGSIVIDANQLRAGMYMYALLVDGKEIDVKRMILTGK